MFWNGKVVVDKTIYVYDGTILNITGVGALANMDGNSTNQVLVVVNASVHLTGVNISHGAGTCLLYTSPSPRDLSTSRMPSSA